MAYTPAFEIADFDDMLFDLLGTVINEVIAQAPTLVVLSVMTVILTLASLLIASVFGIIKLPGLPRGK